MFEIIKYELIQRIKTWDRIESTHQPTNCATSPRTWFNTLSTSGKQAKTLLVRVCSSFTDHKKQHESRVMRIITYFFFSPSSLCFTFLSFFDNLCSLFSCANCTRMETNSFIYIFLPLFSLHFASMSSVIDSLKLLVPISKNSSAD